MINHFPSLEAAKAHLVAKNFIKQNPALLYPGSWLSRDGVVTAQIVIDPNRGVYVAFSETIPS